MEQGPEVVSKWLAPLFRSHVEDAYAEYQAFKLLPEPPSPHYLFFFLESINVRPRAGLQNPCSTSWYMISSRVASGCPCYARRIM